ncbi:MAG: hypothetical protein WDM78_10450 [Puia sp.]
MINWDHVLHDISWFHFSAISPALNESVAAVCLEALQAASKRNIIISIDLKSPRRNYGGHQKSAQFNGGTASALRRRDG